MLDVVGSPGGKSHTIPPPLYLSVYPWLNFQIDPLFFLHHTNLDRLWWEWQSANLSSRLYAISGTNIPSQTYLSQNGFEYPSAALTDYNGDYGNTTTLNHILWMAGIVPNATVGEVMDLQGERICAEYVY